MWFKCDRRALDLNDDFYFGVVYIPPYDSRFYTKDEMDLFQAEVSSMCISHEYVSLMGDFDSRLCNNPDFIDADKYFSDCFEFDENLTNYLNASSSLDSIKFSKCHVSQDTVINNSGYLLLDMCKSNNLFILNGRCGADINIGAMTFRGQSVISRAA